MSTRVLSSILGFPRIGANRELKKATEAFWAGKLSEAELQETAKSLRLQHWSLQKSQGLDVVPSNDFSFYDQILDHSLLFNVVPKRYQGYNLSPLETLFAMGRGLQRKADVANNKQAVDVTSEEMVKFFDSNYHIFRPELSHDTTFKLNTTKPIDEFLEAKAAGIHTRPVLVGPVSFLHYGKAAKDSAGLSPLSLLEQLLPVYEELLGKLRAAGADWVQIDEPILVFDLPETVLSSYKLAYDRLTSVVSENRPKIVFTTYFGSIQHNTDVIKSLPVEGLHLDLVRAPEQLDSVLANLNPSQRLVSLGVVDGRNIWKTDLKKTIALVRKIADRVTQDGRQLLVSSSSSLLHTPHTLESESKSLSPEVKAWFAFAKEKCLELSIIARAVNDGETSEEKVRSHLEENEAALKAKSSSPITNDPAVRQRQASVTQSDKKRHSAFPERQKQQRARMNLPSFPTTTIGSFPQTRDIRLARDKYAKGQLSDREYEEFINKEIESVVRFQEEVGLDVLVHGEPERNDMVQYFGEKMKGFAFTENGWVQSYGSRCVRPPIIIGDISRPAPMTVKESKYAQSITKKHMKGMLTGPVTCLRWSFPRDDVHPSVQAEQLALALRDEVSDLEEAGILVIQVDEPAIREGLPLRREEWDGYLTWAVDSFRLATSSVKDSTQIHSHFCYSDFQDIFHAIQNLDTDVISIENSKSDSKLLQVFEQHKYASEIGPGLFDIHSPRVPPVEEFIARIEELLRYIPRDNLWLNPDCGLKTRGWTETKAALKNLVDAARQARSQQA